MGGAVSAGRDNDELIDNLVEGGYIKTTVVERVFRAVDRGLYYLPHVKDQAYMDQAWKEGVLHISAPCIYTEVLESLKVEPGMAFLNVGSGTGYLSTLVGLLLGAHGVNHGVEVHGSNVKYATERLQVFRLESLALQYYDFTAPQFLVGNGLILGKEFQNRYDRIYVGAGCDDPEGLKCLAGYLKIGGWMIVPSNDHLVRIIRTGEIELSRENGMQCSFASLIQPHSGLYNDVCTCIPPNSTLLTLKQCVRLVVRRQLRNHIFVNHPEVYMPRSHNKHTTKSAAVPRLRRVICPVHVVQNNANGEPEVFLGDPIHDVPGVGEEEPMQAALPDAANAMEDVMGALFENMQNAVMEHVASADSVDHDGNHASHSSDDAVTAAMESDGDWEKLDSPVNAAVRNFVKRDRDVEKAGASESSSSSSRETSCSTSEEEGHVDCQSQDNNVQCEKRRLSARTISDSMTPGALPTSSMKRTTPDVASGQLNMFNQANASSSHGSTAPGQNSVSAQAREVTSALSSMMNALNVAPMVGQNIASVSSPQNGLVSPKTLDGVPKETTLPQAHPPAAPWMEILMMRAIKQLPCPKALYRYLNLDHPLDEKACCRDYCT